VPFARQKAISTQGRKPRSGYEERACQPCEEWAGQKEFEQRPDYRRSGVAPILQPPSTLLSSSRNPLWRDLGRALSFGPL